MRPQSTTSVALLEMNKGGGGGGGECLGRKTCSVQANCHVCKDSTRLPPDMTESAEALQKALPAS